MWRASRHGRFLGRSVRFPSDLGIDSKRLAVGGHSAGGNLAAVTTQRVRERGGPALAFQLLVLPITDCAARTPSRHENARGYLLTAEMLEWSTRRYLRDEADRRTHEASPLLAQELPAAMIITAEYDPLRDEGEQYAEKLRQAGVPVALRRFDGAIHAFFILGGVMEQGRHAIQEAAAALRQAFASS